MSDFIDRTQADIRAERDSEVRAALSDALEAEPLMAADGSQYSGQDAAYWHIRAVAFEKVARDRAR